MHLNCEKYIEKVYTKMLYDIVVFIAIAAAAVVAASALPFSFLFSFRSITMYITLLVLFALSFF